MPLPSTVTNTFVYDGVTYNLSAATRVGYTVTGEPVVEWQSGLQWTGSSEPSRQYQMLGTLGPGVSANAGVLPTNLPLSWISGAEWATGRNTSYAHGANSYGDGSDERTGIGLDERPLPSVLIDAQKNIDPARTGQPFAIPGAGTLAKAVGREEPGLLPGYKYFEKYHHIHFVKTWPNAGCFQPNPWQADPEPSLATVSDADLDLTGLQNYDIGGNPTAVITRFNQPIWHGWTYSVRMCRYRQDVWSVYGREISNEFNAGAVCLMSSAATLEQKRQIARGFVARALDIVYRIQQGGFFQPSLSGGGHQSPWGPVVAIAAWLTRNSVAGQIFRDVLDLHATSAPAVVRPLNQSLMFTRQVTQRDWGANTAPANTDARLNPIFVVDFPGYFSSQVRPYMDGIQWGNGASPGGDPAMLHRHGMSPYSNNNLFAPLVMWWMLSKLGARSTYNDPNFWGFYDFCLSNHLAYRNELSWTTAKDGRRSSNPPTAFGGFRGEWNSDTDGIADGLGNWVPLMLDPVAGWNYPSQPAPVAVGGGVATVIAVARETRASNSGAQIFDLQDETWVWLEFNTDLLWAPGTGAGGSMPTNSQITIQRTRGGNTISVAIDTARADGTNGSIAGDSRTNGAIQIRRNRIGFAVDPSIDAQPGDVWTVTTNWAGSATQPRTIDGQLVPNVTVSPTITVRTPSLEAPAAPRLLSLGNFQAGDTTKFIRVIGNSQYLSQRYGLRTDLANDPSIVINQLLIGIRGWRLPQQWQDDPQNLNIISNGNTSSNDFRITSGRVSADAFVFGGDFPSRAFAGAPDIIRPTPPWGNGTQVLQTEFTYWYLIDYTPGAGFTRQARRVGNGAVETRGPTNTQTQSPTNNYGAMNVARLFTRPTSPTPVPMSQTGQFQIGGYRGFQFRELYVAVGTPVRPLPAIDLSQPQFYSPWGPRGQNVLPTRASYAQQRGPVGTPEIYLSIDEAQIAANIFTNFGEWTALTGFGPTPALDPEGAPLPIGWVSAP